MSISFPSCSLEQGVFMDNKTAWLTIEQMSELF